MKHDAAPIGPNSPSELFAALEEVLRRQTDLHVQLLEYLRRKRSAIARADIHGISELCQAENRLLQKLGDEERYRLRLVAVLTEHLAPAAKRPLSMRELIEAVPRSRQSHLRERAESLRAAMSVVQQESSVITTAATALSRHLSGIMQMVHRTLSASGIYERRGRVDVGRQAEYCVDLKS